MLMIVTYDGMIVTISFDAPSIYVYSVVTIRH